MTNTLPNFPLFSNALGYASNEDQIAIDDVRLNTSFTYKQLVLAISALKAELLKDKR
jgi:hypothetical protein